MAVRHNRESPVMIPLTVFRVQARLPERKSCRANPGLWKKQVISHPHRWQRFVHKPRSSWRTAKLPKRGGAANFSVVARRLPSLRQPGAHWPELTLPPEFPSAYIGKYHPSRHGLWTHTHPHPTGVPGKPRDGHRRFAGAGPMKKKTVTSHIMHSVY